MAPGETVGLYQVGDTGSVDIHIYEGPVSTSRVSLTESGTQIPACGGGGCGNSYNAAYDDASVLGGNSVMSADGNTIVFAPRPYVLVVLVRGLDDETKGHALIAAITHEIDEAVR